MKKSLLALAVAAALPGLAFAQTNVILNGSVDGSLEYLDKDANQLVSGNPVADSDLKITNGVWAGSRFAISGTEELGGGLKGIFNFEHRFNVDTGAQSEQRFWHGQAWVGLQGGFGAVRLGRQYTPMFRALAGGDVTGYSWYNNLSGGVTPSTTTGAGFGTVGGWTLRRDDAVTYQSPSLGGFTIHAMYAAGESKTTGSAATISPGVGGAAIAPYNSDVNDMFSIGALGNFGPVNVGVAYSKTDAGDVPGASDPTELGVALGAKFGNFGVGLAAVQTENLLDVKRKGYYASGSMGIGAGTLYLVYFQDDVGSDTNDVTGLTLTYSYGLSKRTFVYGSVGANKTEDDIGPEDRKPLRVALGVRHFF